MTEAMAFQEDRFRTYTPQRLVALAMRHSPTIQPGTGFAYSDTDYILAGMIIQRVTGRSWQDEVNARIIRPLGLQHTVTPGTYPLITGPRAEGYADFGTTTPMDVTAFNPSAAGASGSMVSTADDLTRFYTALIGGRLLSPAQLAAMETTVPAPALGPGVALRAWSGMDPPARRRRAFRPSRRYLRLPDLGRGHRGCPTRRRKNSWTQRMWRHVHA